MKTKITEMLGIQYPIILSGMSWISVPKMVAAVSNAGGLGILATGPFNPDETRAAVREIRSLTDRPFGANAPLVLPGARDNARVLIEERVPVINYALGKGDWLIREVHAYGGKVLSTVVNDLHAIRAQEQGADGVIATGHEAAGHGGDATSLVLIPHLVDMLKIPVVAAGGFADGRGLAAALSLGASAVAMGTRFMTTRESALHANYKKISIEKDIYSTLYSTRFDGIPCRVMENRASRAMLKKRLNLPAAFFNSQIIARQLRLPYWKLFFGVLLSGWKSARQLAYFANAYKLILAATERGDTVGGLLPMGQVTGLIQDEPTVAELMERIVQEAKSVLADRYAMM